MNRIKKQRVYLAGAIDRVPDRGVGWREEIIPFLESLGAVVYNPLTKPMSIGKEDENSYVLKRSLKEKKDYEGLSHLMRVIRSTDLRLVDVSDFLLVNLDIETHPCGTYEEIFRANRQKKPIIIRIKQGKQNAPDWLFGTIPHDMIFSCWDSVKDYLLYIDRSENIKTLDRWYFINN